MLQQESLTPAAAVSEASEPLYYLSRDKQGGGRVIVNNNKTGEVVRIFKMNPELAVHKAFFLDGGKTVVGSQKEQTIFWDIQTGKEIANLNLRTYGFVPDESRFITRNLQGELFLFSYPKLEKVCLLSAGLEGPSTLRFSPNSKFTAIQFATAYPHAEELDFDQNSVMSTIYYNILMDLEKCQKINEVESSKYGFIDLGMFSLDSNYYYFHASVILNRELYREQRIGWGFLRLNLSNHKIELLARSEFLS